MLDKIKKLKVQATKDRNKIEQDAYNAVISSLLTAKGRGVEVTDAMVLDAVKKEIKIFKETQSADKSLLEQYLQKAENNEKKQGRKGENMSKTDKEKELLREELESLNKILDGLDCSGGKYHLVSQTIREIEKELENMPVKELLLSILEQYTERLLSLPIDQMYQFDKLAWINETPSALELVDNVAEAALTPAGVPESIARDVVEDMRDAAIEIEGLLNSITNRLDFIDDGLATGFRNEFNEPIRNIRSCRKI